MFADNSTTKGYGNTKIGRKVVRATADILHHVQGQGHQANLGGCSNKHLQGQAHIVDIQHIQDIQLVVCEVSGM